jgi:hypothetical protein
MPSTINADNGVVSGITGIRTTADNSGNLSFQANGVTLLTVATNNTIVLGNTLKFADGTTANTAASGGGASWGGIKTANFTANASTIYVVSTVSQPVFVTLPASPSAGNTVQLTDYARTWASNAVTLLPNGSNITNATANVALNTNGASVALIYTDASQGWIAFNGFSTPPVGAYTVSYLLVAGGGSGGYLSANNVGTGGGGAGGVITTTTSFIPGTAYTITVGAGGTGSGGGVNGVNSSISTVATAIGGGFGSGSATAASAGGSGGGGSYGGSSGGSGTAGQGNTGGTYSSGNPYYGAAGGGGAGAVGSNSSTAGGAAAGAGGIGVSSSISGSAVFYGGGGGGGVTNGSSQVGAGGSGGGAAGATSSSVNSGTANTGGGGGGTGRPDSSSATNGGGNGGSGICIISYLGTQRGSGGTVTSSGGYTIHTFTSSGTYTA